MFLLISLLVRKKKKSRILPGFFKCVIYAYVYIIHYVNRLIDRQADRYFASSPGL